MQTDRSWFGVDGALEPIRYQGRSDFRFPEAVADHAITRYSQPGDWVLDPFAGFGTTLVVAERLGRHAVGIEADRARAAFAGSRLRDPNRLIHAGIDDVPRNPWPPYALILTSPPYGSFRGNEDDDEPDVYQADARRLFAKLAAWLAPGGRLVVEVSQLRRGDTTRPLVWELGQLISEQLELVEDVVRVNTGATEAGPGYDHAHLLVFRHGR